MVIRNHNLEGSIDVNMVLPKTLGWFNKTAHLATLSLINIRRVFAPINRKNSLMNKDKDKNPCPILQGNQCVFVRITPIVADPGEEAIGKCPPNRSDEGGNFKIANADSLGHQSQENYGLVSFAPVHKPGNWCCIQLAGVVLIGPKASVSLIRLPTTTRAQ